MRERHHRWKGEKNLIQMASSIFHYILDQFLCYINKTIVLILIFGRFVFNISMLVFKLFTFRMIQYSTSIASQVTVSKKKDL